MKRGHRFSTDDMAAAWRAAHAKPSAMNLLDLGCGIGSVGLMTLKRLGNPAARMTAVEVQEISAALYRKTIAYNGLEDRITLINEDLREVHLPGGYDLITGSPPYIPVGKGIISPHPQRAGARMELRGSVYDYCAAARRFLAPGGRFCFVMAAADPRTEDAPLAHGFSIVERCDFVFREGRDPLICTIVCALEDDAPPERVSRTLVVRDARGDWTPEYEALRQEMGLAS